MSTADMSISVAVADFQLIVKDGSSLKKKRPWCASDQMASPMSKTPNRWICCSAGAVLL